MGGIITLLKRSAQSFSSDKCSTLAAAIAYYTVFSLFPLALLGISLLGFFMGDESARQRVIDGIANVITLGDEGEQALANTLAGTSAAKGWVGLFGLITAAWSASALFGAMRMALDAVWDVDRPLPMLRAKFRDVLLMFGFGGLLGVSTASTGVLQGARAAGAEWLGPVVDMAAPLFTLLTFLAPLAVTFAAFMFLYRVAPHAKLGLRDVWPAALMVALFFEFGKNLLAMYFRMSGNLNALAGSLGAAILFLAFVYYASQVILLAAEFTKHLMLVRAGTLPATDPKPAKAEKESMGETVKDKVADLWRIEEPHHDHELPYQPARLDPVTNRPTNTKEEVELKIEEANQTQAEKNAAKSGANGTARGQETTPGGGQMMVAHPVAADAGRGKGKDEGFVRMAEVAGMAIGLIAARRKNSAKAEAKSTKKKQSKDKRDGDDRYYFP